MTTVPQVTRDQVLAHRYAAQQLDRRHGVDADDLAIWDTGLQNSPFGDADDVLAARLPLATSIPDLAKPGAYATVWAMRGAPATIRRRDLKRIAAALRPVDSDDAAKRLFYSGTAMKRAGLDPYEAFGDLVRLLHAVVTDEQTKSEASAELTRRAPDALNVDCRSCGTRHIGEMVMRLPSPAAGVALVPGSKPARVRPVGRFGAVVDAPAGLPRLITDYLHVCGPAPVAAVAAFLDTTPTVLKRVWPTELAAVRVGSTTAWLPQVDLADLTAGTPPSATQVRLLSRSDPWMLMRDRELVVPAKAARAQLYKPLGRPGGVLAGTELVGTWRLTGGAKPTVTVAALPGATLPARRSLAREAERLAEIRGSDRVDLAVD